MIEAKPPPRLVVTVSERTGLYLGAFFGAKFIGVLVEQTLACVIRRDGFDAAPPFFGKGLSAPPNAVAKQDIVNVVAPPSGPFPWRAGAFVRHSRPRVVLDQII
jgi:hypothetical protein